jgi:hypothetical protein
MRKIVKQLGLAVGALLLAAPVTNAALITLDVRLAGGGKNLLIGPSQVVTMEVYAQVQNLDGNRANDGFLLTHGSLVSTEGPGALLGNISTPTLATPFIDAGVSSAGVQANLDLNNDLEVGSSTPANAAGYVVFSTGTATKFGAGSGTGVTEFLLGSFTWTGPSAVDGGLSTEINFALRNKTDGLASSRQLFKGSSDGVAFNLTGADVNVALGAPVTLSTIPEPTSIGLAMLGLTGLLARRRK